MKKFKKSKEWLKCYCSYMKTKEFWIYMLVSNILFSFAYICLCACIYACQESLWFYFGFALILFVVFMFLDYIVIKELFDKLEIHMNKYGYTLEKDGILKDESEIK